MKHDTVQSGSYAGKHAVILGTDIEHLGHSIYKENNMLGHSYVVRWAQELFPIDGEVLICNIDGELVALNESNFKKENKKNESGTGSKGTESNDKSSS